MNADEAAGLLSDLGRVCVTCAVPDDLLADALPLLLDLAGARAVVVVRPSGGGRYRVAAQAGHPLEPDDSLLDLPGLEGGRLSAVAVPAAWAADGIVHGSAMPLPGRGGVVILAWDDDLQPAMSWLSAALALVDGALTRLHAEDQLSDLMQRVDSAQQLANMGDYDWHIASDTNRWSDQLYRIYGHVPQSFNASYERFLSHIHPDDRGRIAEIHQHAYATGEPYQMIERIVRPDGQVRFLSSNGQVIRDADGAPVRMRGTCIDVTDRILAEQERERIAARFRSLVESAPDAIMVVDIHGQIVQANGRANELLGAEPVGHALDEVSPSAGAAGHAVVATGLDGRALRLDVSTAQLSRVDDEGMTAIFLRDAAPRLASEAVAAALREAQVRRHQALEINDNVVQGLTAALYSLAGGNVEAGTSYLERTVSAARRLMNEWLHPFDGAELRPGDLVRDAPSTLDDAPHHGPHDDAAPDAAGIAAEQPPRILIVDDNDDVRTLIREHVEAIGSYDVIGEAADGEEAVQLASRLRPDLVLLDLAMPRMDGLQALPLILDAVPGVRVIVLSGFDQGTMAEKALAAGAACYVEKSIRINLAATLADVLNAA
jgi:PAS domain S-box-containing protein